MNDLRVSERDKYERMWSVPEYRRFSPGGQAAPLAIERLQIPPGASVLDAGAGTCRAATVFNRHGCAASACDFVANAFEPADGVQCFEHDLTEPLPEVYDFVFCADVLEHIPPEQTSTVLAHLFGAARAGVYFTVAHFRDGFGKQIGETLHLNVQHRAWWASLFGEYFGARGWSFDFADDPRGPETTHYWMRSRDGA